MKLFALFILVFLTACGTKVSPVKYGKTTVADLIQLKGNPEGREDIPVSGDQILLYPDEVKFQAQGEVVTAGFRNPEGAERTLLYWKNRFKDCETAVVKISQDEEEFACPALGMSVVYTKEADFISRVVEYEAK